MEQFSNLHGIRIVFDLIAAIQENKQYLSDIDGAIGDGDHGINMNKGFTLCRDELLANPGDLTHGLKTSVEDPDDEDRGIDGAPLRYLLQIHGRGVVTGWRPSTRRCSAGCSLPAERGYRRSATPSRATKP